jgi:hypothetical protein
MIGPGQPAGVNDKPDGSVLLGMLWMAVISLLLFWLPGLGPLIAGIVGGKVAGGIGAGLIAALLPAVLFGVLLIFLATYLTGIPLIGAIAGAGGVALALTQIGPLLVGALIGGLLA